MPNRRTSPAAKITGECLALRLKMANRVITKVYDDALRPLGIRITQAAMLAFASERGLLRQSELCTELQLDDSTLSRNLDRMRKNGWIEESNGDDGREHPYQITAKGKALLTRLLPRWEEAQDQASRLLGKTGVEALRAFAQKQGLGD